MTSPICLDMVSQCFRSWFGTNSILNFIHHAYFPINLTVSTTHLLGLRHILELVLFTLQKPHTYHIARGLECSDVTRRCAPRRLGLIFILAGCLYISLKAFRWDESARKTKIIGSSPLEFRRHSTVLVAVLARGGIRDPCCCACTKYLLAILHNSGSTCAIHMLSRIKNILKPRKPLRSQDDRKDMDDRETFPPTRAANSVCN